MLYHTEEILGLKKRKAYSSKHRAWLLGVVTTNDIPTQIPRSKPYSMVIFPDAFIFPAYESDSITCSRGIKYYFCDWTI